RDRLRGRAPGAARAGRPVQPAGREFCGDPPVSIWRKTAVVGAYEHPTRFAPHMTPFQIHAESARGALADAGLTIRDVDGFFTSGVGPIGIMSLAQHLDLRPCYLDAQSIGGSSFSPPCLPPPPPSPGGLSPVPPAPTGPPPPPDR